MAKWSAFCIIYLVATAPSFVDGRRIQSSAYERTVASHEAKEEASSEHPWCNPFSSLSTRSYHFDVTLDEDKCEQGHCVAIELVRHKDEPIMKLHSGKAWLVKPGQEKGDLQWSLFEPGKSINVEKVIHLTDVELIRLYDKTEKHPDKLEITLSEGKAENATAGNAIRNKDVFELEGGLYYDEDLISEGFDKLHAEDYEKIQNEAAKPTYRAEGARVGKWVGAAGGALTVGGFYTAATVTGVAVQTQALVGAALVGTIGGAVGGAIAGGFIGLGIALAAIMGGYGTTRNGHEIVSAGRKVYEKLRCIPEFTECEYNILVPNSRDCPRK